MASTRREQSALGGAALMASQQKEADCAAGQNLRVASYNVLSSKLCEPGYFVKCAKENLDPPTRLKRVQALLETETKKNAVVCLQEVSREWSGDLHAFFARQGYQFTTGLYGNPFNGCRAVQLLSTPRAPAGDGSAVHPRRALVARPPGELRRVDTEATVVAGPAAVAASRVVPIRNGPVLSERSCHWCAGTGIKAVRQMENEANGIEGEMVYPYQIFKN